MEPVNIFAHDSYREFLNVWLRQAKLTKQSNLSRLAEIANVHATFLSQVLSGRKDLSLEQAALLSAHIGLTKLERDYFFASIQLDRAGNEELRKYWSEKRSELNKQRNKLSERFAKHEELSLEQKAMFYSSWLYSAIRLYTDVGGGRTLVDVAAHLSLRLSKCEEILEFLVETALCRQLNGKFVMGPAHIHVPNESPFVLKHHTNWRMRAVTSMDVRQPNDLFLTAPMIISRHDFEVIREQLNHMIKSVVETAKKSSSEELACLNIDFFKLISPK